jgi:DNA replication protein DnaC
LTYKVEQLPSLQRHWLMRNSNIPMRFLGIEPTDLNAEVPSAIGEWLEEMLAGTVIKQVGGLGLTGVGLLLDGGPGLGKTTMAVTSAMEFIRRLPTEDIEARKILKYSKTDDYGMLSRPIYYLTYPEFMSLKKSTFDADHDEKRELNRIIEGLHGRAKEDWLNVRLLILDDLGKEYGSKYDDTSFDEILRSRYDRALPTIVTTNVLLENWGSQYSKAMESFGNEAFIRVKLVNQDLRRVRA